MKTKVGLMILMLLLLCGANGWAKVAGQCSDCHTMHNSQGGASVTGDGLHGSLTTGDCVGCHTGTNVVGGNIPYVMTPTLSEYGPDYVTITGVLTNNVATNSLAGGTFNMVESVAGADQFGHNVVGISDPDGMGQTPPGWVAITFPAAGGNAVADNWTTQQLTCAGTNGCHGDHTNADDFGDIRGAHHGDDSNINGNTVASSFRFLKGIMGTEAADWELAVSAANHNGYRGADRIAANSTTTGSLDATTISYLCAECHGLFHSGTGEIITGDDPTTASNNPWLRHPSDFALGNAGPVEYADYANADGALYTAGPLAYNYIAPLASVTGAAVSDPLAAGAGVNDIVMCLSCHRAHGSAHDDLLRWDYNDIATGGEMVAGTSTAFDNKGCFACHTTKD